jgi:hypothetical protein
VVIKSCRKVSYRKAYYIRNVVKQAGRYDYWENMMKERKTQIKLLMNENLEKLKEETKKELKSADGQLNKADIIRRLKVKAMTQAFDRLKEKQFRDRMETRKEESA